MRRALWLWAASTLIFAGCAGTSIGDPFETAGGGCKPEPRELDSLDSSTPLGITPAQVLAVAAGEHQVTALWSESQGPFAFEPERGTGKLMIEVEPRATKPRFVEYRVESSNDGIELGTLPCAPEIEVDVSVRIKSEGGALNEAFDSTLRAQSKRLVNLSKSFEPEQLKGALQLSASPARAELDNWSLALSFSEFSVSGSLTGSATERSSDAVSNSSLTVARWPAVNNCDFDGIPATLESKLGSFTATDGVNLAKRATGLQLSWPSGTQAGLSLDFTPAADGVCVYGLQVGGIPEPLRFVVSGQAAVKSDDGRIDGSWQVVLSAIADEQDGLARVELARDRYGTIIGGFVEASEFEALYGVHDVDLSGFDQATADLRLTLLDQESGVNATGSLELRGAIIPECSKNPPKPMMGSDGSVSVQGCRGWDLRSIETADITN